jgi:hypothetical protein
VPVFPKQITDHLGKELTIGKRPVFSREASIVAGNKRSGDDQEKRRASDENCKSVKALAHILPSSNCRLPTAENWQSAIDNRK